MRKRLFVAGLMSGLVLFAATPGESQTVQQSGTLFVSGRSGQATVIQADSRSFVDVEALARIVNGTLSFSGSRIVLTLPGTGGAMGMSGQPAIQPAAPPAAPQGLSRDFVRAGIEAGAEIREWRSALETAVRYGFPPGDTWIDRYSGAAATALSLTSAAISTDDDRKAFQLLNNAYNNMQSLSTKMLSARKNMNYIAPDALQNDPLDQKIVACGQALHAMAATGHYQDASVCQ
ncbi:MAG: hypothetical protein JOZ83_11295 [Silvibacterium sp.]|nr:hypothetical protein [Silvibacterium sp.]